jgi:hypothetical protein
MSSNYSTKIGVIEIGCNWAMMPRSQEFGTIWEFSKNSILFLLKINFFLYVLDCFDTLILKIIFLK